MLFIHRSVRKGDHTYVCNDQAVYQEENYINDKKGCKLMLLEKADQKYELSEKQTTDDRHRSKDAVATFQSSHRSYSASVKHEEDQENTKKEQTYKAIKGESKTETSKQSSSIEFSIIINITHRFICL